MPSAGVGFPPFRKRITSGSCSSAKRSSRSPGATGRKSIRLVSSSIDMIASGLTSYKAGLADTKSGALPRFFDPKFVCRKSVRGLGLVLLFLELLGKILVVLGHEVLQLLLAVL